MADILERLRAADLDMLWRDAAAEIERLEAENERLRAALVSVRAEVDLRKAPKLMAKIEAALGHEQKTSTEG